MEPLPTTKPVAWRVAAGFMRPPCCSRLVHLESTVSLCTEPDKLTGPHGARCRVPKTRRDQRATVLGHFLAVGLAQCLCRHGNCPRGDGSSRGRGEQWQAGQSLGAGLTLPRSHCSHEVSAEDCSDGGTCPRAPDPLPQPPAWLQLPLWPPACLTRATCKLPQQWPPCTRRWCATMLSTPLSHAGPLTRAL